MINPGDIVPRRDVNSELFIAVLSNAAHLQAATGRVVVCPFVPGALPDDAMALVVPVDHPAGVLLPELVQWLPASALDEPVGNVGALATARAVGIVHALIAAD